MRHLGSLIAGVIAVPLGWLLLAFGQTHASIVYQRVTATGSYHPTDYAHPAIYLALAGLALGLLACLRISPVGPLVAGLAFAASFLGLLVAPDRIYHLLSYHISIAHQQAELTAPLTSGTSLAFGTLLIVAVFSGTRWRSRPAGTTNDNVDEYPNASATGGLSAWTDPTGFSAVDTPSDLPDSSVSTGSSFPVASGSYEALPVRTPRAWTPAPTASGPTEAGAGSSPWATPLGSANPPA